MRVLTIKNRYLTMKLELVLTMKIVDNFVRFGMPYVPRPPPFFVLRFAYYTERKPKRPGNEAR